jgi:hypothetical protein
MSVTPPPNSPFVSPSIYLPDDDDQRIIRVTDLLSQLANAVNLRDISIYEPFENSTGQSWFSDNLTTTSTEKEIPFRQVFVFPNIAAPGTTSVAHNITNLAFCTKIYGTACNVPVAPALYPTTFIPLPQPTPDDVAITVDATNINVICATGTYNAFQGLVILEYFHE